MSKLTAICSGKNEKNVLGSQIETATVGEKIRSRLVKSVNYFGKAAVFAAVPALGLVTGGLATAMWVGAATFAVPGAAALLGI